MEYIRIYRDEMGISKLYTHYYRILGLESRLIVEYTLNLIRDFLCGNLGCSYIRYKYTEGWRGFRRVVFRLRGVCKKSRLVLMREHFRKPNQVLKLKPKSHNF